MNTNEDLVRARLYDIRDRLDQEKIVSASVGNLSARGYLDLFPPIEGKVVLDAGLGNGWVCEVFAARQPALIYGVDISPNRIEAITAKFSGFSVPHEFHAGSVEDLSFIPDGRVDFINCRDVIEHLANPRECLREFKRVLRPGGQLLLQTPNALIHCKLVLEHMFAEMFHRFLHDTPREYHDDDPLLFQDSERVTAAERDVLKAAEVAGIQEHQQFWEPQEFWDLLTEAGFTAQKMGGTPLLSAEFYQSGPMMPRLTSTYCRFVESPFYGELLEAFMRDLASAGRIDRRLLEFPASYVISDDLILLAASGSQVDSDAG